MSRWICRLFPWHSWNWTGRKAVITWEAKCSWCGLLWAVCLESGPNNCAALPSEEFEASIGWRS